MDTYEKKYKNALEKAKSMIDDLRKSEDILTVSDLESMFPELKESEDEKIRKEIVRFIRMEVEDEIVGNKWLAWLEKQGEQKPVFEVKTPEESLGIDSDTYNKIVDECIYGEQKSIIDIDKMVDEFAHTEVKGYGMPTMIEVDAYRKGVNDALCLSSNLEKQGEQEEPQVYETEDGEVITYSESEGYKVIEPKFHEGDWITNGLCTFHITSLDKNYYWSEEDTVGGDIESINKQYHLWTIEDAKDGDVLATEDKNFATPFIAIYKSLGDTVYKGLRDNITFNSHCFIGFNGNFYKGEEGHAIEDIHPATKEQRDMLKKAIADAGWEFDFEKKELKKIEQKSAWTEEDEKNLQGIIDEIEANKDYAESCDIPAYDRCLNWLKSIKERIGG